METDYYFYAPDPDAVNHHFFESAYEYQDYLASLLGEDDTDEDTEETEKFTMRDFSTRDDIYEILLRNGLEKEMAFEITEFIRKLNKGGKS